MSVRHSFQGGGNWLFTDPYAYQYSDIPEEDQVHAYNTSTTPRSQDTSSDRFELEGSSPTTASEGRGLRAELEGSSVEHSPVELEADCHLTPRLNTPPDAPALQARTPSMLARNRFANVRVSRKYPHRRAGSAASPCVLPEVVVAEPPPASRPTAKARLSHTPLPQAVVDKVASPLLPLRPRSMIAACDSGLILVGEDTPPSDFEGILRNISPLHNKKEKRLGSSSANVRGSRYYDRYSTNFG
ncbi:hypothetical protein F4779DRAFT_599079 [Xylariaceae sp. FL0662B]|nr:hypothetical protein F4779DRAFT_599079 [Xylariaceae sp. FL0662B]